MNTVLHSSSYVGLQKMLLCGLDLVCVEILTSCNQDEFMVALSGRRRVTRHASWCDTSMKKTSNLKTSSCLSELLLYLILITNIWIFYPKSIPPFTESVWPADSHKQSSAIANKHRSNVVVQSTCHELRLFGCEVRYHACYIFWDTYACIHAQILIR